MRPIPVAFHIWFIEVHTYGIGLALTFWFGLRYTERRLRTNGYPWLWVTGMFLWVIAAAIIGARTMNVVSNLGQYSQHPWTVFAIWQGGLSSFGGLLFAVPTGIVIARKRCPEVAIVRLLDLITPVLAACWSMGRLLGPQMMYAGGGHPTNQWFGMYYAGQTNAAGQLDKRLPVPIFQAMEDAAIFGILLLIERWLRTRAPRPLTPSPGNPVPVRLLYPNGIILGTGMFLWGIERFLDEHLWLGEDGHLGSLLVQFAGIGLAVSGLVLLLTRIGPLRRWLAGDLGDVDDLGDDGRDGAGDAVADGPDGVGSDPDGADGSGDGGDADDGGPDRGDADDEREPVTTGAGADPGVTVPASSDADRDPDD
jgi:phosphatidylglycerol:prolipoprotein diacylglycerol transferase